VFYALSKVKAAEEEGGSRTKGKNGKTGKGEILKEGRAYGARSVARSAAKKLLFRWSKQGKPERRETGGGRKKREMIKKMGGT